jgi:hypothetical protein
MGFFDWFKKKKKMTPEQLESIRTKFSSPGPKQFQWNHASENRGQVTYFKDVVFEDGIVWVLFTNGTRCNYDLLGEFLVAVDGEPLDLDIPKVSSALATPVSASVSAKSVPIKPSSPIHSLLQKQRPNMVDLDLRLTLNVPSHNLYEILNSSFENAEDDIINYALQDVNIQVVQEAIRKAIREYYAKT